MQPAILDAYADQLPRLRAEASLVAVERLGVGTGAFRKQDRRRLLSSWSRTANYRRVVMRAPDRATYEATMRGVGLPVKFERPPADG